MENSSLNHTENHKTEEKETKRTPIKQRKENEVLRFHLGAHPVFAAGALVVVLILVLAMCARSRRDPTLMSW